ncbi:MAG: heparinase II/III family protein [Actinomycetota bacterium]|nr:heparinase II/III family protein [Actinomycetota bacterium]
MIGSSLAWLRRGFSIWRRLGVRRGTAAAATLAASPVRRRVRPARLRARPPRVGPRELRWALSASDLASLLRGPVLDAMPSVGAFERQLDMIDERSRAHLLAVAERACAHQFDLLGSGLTDLGPRIDWRRDFKSGRTWPLDHISKLVISYPDDSDIKVPWELSRFQHLPLLAAAHRITGERRWIDEIGAQVQSWIAENPTEFGPNWACTMDVAIRAANWIATLALVADAVAREAWLRPAMASLLLHGRFIRSHLEWAPVRGNHYLSDVVGLLSVAALFGRGREGRRWARFAARELAVEMRHQVRPDGCDHEASIPYHRLVAELFVCGTQAAQALVPGALSAEHRARLGAMLGFVADYTRPDGLAPQVGDADDGRYLPLGDYGRADPRSHLHLFAQAHRPYVQRTAHAAYPDGGYWIMRAGDIYVLVRCGDVGVGSHAHNDALAFELAIGGQQVVVDPGSYLYTADPVERDRFRSTAFHSTLTIDGQEQNPISPEALFAMEDRRRAEALAWDHSPRRPSFIGAHHGYESLPQPATHTRRIELDVAASELLIVDTVASAGAHELTWTFPLAPCEATAAGNHATATFGGGLALELDAPGVELRVEDGWISPSYGRRIATAFLRGRKRSSVGEDVITITLRIRSRS